jgi:hypothetical protein
LEFAGVFAGVLLLNACYTNIIQTNTKQYFYVQYNFLSVSPHTMLNDTAVTPAALERAPLDL